MQKVYIRHEPSKGTIFVCHFDPAKYERRLYAQFADDMRSMEDIQNWVKANRELELVCAISGKRIGSEEIVNEPSISEQREMGIHFGACD